MNSLMQLAHDHPFGLLVAFWIFSNAVSTMPSPNGSGWTAGVGYKWLFNFLHAVSGTIGRILAQYPATQKFTGQITPETPTEPAAPAEPPKAGS